jgi:hypothetical protein
MKGNEKIQNHIKIPNFFETQNSLDQLSVMNKNR